MKVTRRETLGLLGALISSSAVGRIAPSSGLDRALARGFNLPDLVPQKFNTKINADQLKILFQVGMRHIRLPIVGENFMPRFSGPATIAYSLDLLDRTLDTLLDLGFAVSVDMHPEEQFPSLLRKQTEDGMAELFAAWKHIGSRIRTRNSRQVFAELLNEPSTVDTIWRPAVGILARRLRQVMPETMFIVGPAPYQRVEALAAWEPLPDRNVTYVFHYYDPMAFTHQGQTWFKNDPLSRLAGFPYPARLGDPRVEVIVASIRERGDKQLLAVLEETLEQPWNGARIRSQFDKLKAWGDSNNVPIILNEFGTLRFKSPRQDRLLWLETVRLAAENAGFGWAHWDYSGGFGLVSERGTIDQGVIKALTGNKSNGLPNR